MNVRKVDEYAPHPKFFSKLTYMGNVTELTAMQKRAYGAPTVRIDKDHYKDLRSGCIHEYAHGETRADNADSVRRTLATVRALINCNVTVPQNCRWLTFTYAENMTDTKRLHRDWCVFWKNSSVGARRTASPFLSTYQLLSRKAVAHGICMCFSSGSKQRLFWITTRLSLRCGGTASQRRKQSATATM